jgi:hypothetical protein
MLALVAELPALAEPMPCGPVESDSQEALTDLPCLPNRDASDD